MPRTIPAIFAGMLLLLGACAAPSAQQPATAAPSTAATQTLAPSPSPTEAPPVETSATEPAAFPVTLDHKYGSTEITKLPERIVTVGLTEQDALLALGVTPVGTTEWFGKHPGAIWPWAKNKLQGETPEVVGDAATINFEKIAALNPDLILAMYSGLTQEQYDLLAKIAPTIAQPATYVDYGIPWQELTNKVGQVVGKAEQANQLVKDVEARFAQVRAEHPEFQGATSVVATPYEGIWVYGPEDVRGRLLTSMGFKLPDNLAEVTGNEFGGNLSLEKAEMLNVDAIIWLDAEEAKGPLGGPLYSTFDVAKEGREIFLKSYTDPLGGATSFVSVLSLPYLLDGLTPMLAAAIDGDPNTAVPASPTASAATPAAGSTESAAAETITITDARGTTVTVPAKPQRIVALTELDLDSTLALGITPVGSVNGRGQTGLPQYLGDKVVEVVSVGSLAEPSLEQIVALKPDLILAGSIIEPIEALLPELNQIAPVVATYKPTDDWKTAFNSIAGVLNRKAEAEVFMAEYDKRAAAVKAALPAGKPALANVVRWMPQGPVLMMPSTFSSLILADVGLSRPEAVQALAGSHGAHTDPISLEKLDVIDSEWLFWGALNPDGATALDTALKNPLVQKLSAVQNKHVTQVDGAVWTSIGGPLAALVVLDDIQKTLAAQ